MKKNLVEEITPNAEDVNGSMMRFSNEKKNEWQYKDNNGTPCTRTQRYFEVYTSNSDQDKKFCFTLCDVKTINGIQTSTKFAKGSALISVNLTKEQSAMVRNNVNQPIYDLVYKNRVAVFKNKSKTDQMTHPSLMQALFMGIVKNGEDKNDGSGTQWNDQITASVPFKKKSSEIIVNENLCRVEDIEGNVFPWSNLDKQKIKEIVFEIDRVTASDTEAKVRCNCRLIVVDAKSAPKIMTKRKLEDSKQKPNNKKQKVEKETEEEMNENE